MKKLMWHLNDALLLSFDAEQQVFYDRALRALMKGGYEASYFNPTLEQVEAVDRKLSTLQANIEQMPDWRDRWAYRRWSRYYVRTNQEARKKAIKLEQMRKYE